LVVGLDLNPRPNRTNASIFFNFQSRILIVRRPDDKQGGQKRNSQDTAGERPIPPLQKSPLIGMVTTDRIAAPDPLGFSEVSTHLKTNIN
jgi:hypothetical protein